MVCLIRVGLGGWVGSRTESKPSGTSSCLREGRLRAPVLGLAKTITSDVYTILLLLQILKPKVSLMTHLAIALNKSIFIFQEVCNGSFTHSSSAIRDPCRTLCRSCLEILSSINARAASFHNINRDIYSGLSLFGLKVFWPMLLQQQL